MSAIVNFGGNDDIIHPRGPLYCSPRKRSRLNAPSYTREKQYHRGQISSLDNLPDECLFEILRRLSGNRERSNSACVSKRWLMLLSSIRASEISVESNNKAFNASERVLPDLNAAVVEDEEEMEIEGAGFLTRCLEEKEVTDVRISAAAVGTAGRGGLGKLLIRGSHPTRGLTNLGLSAVARGCPSLKVLSMWRVPLVNDEGLSELADGCPMLEKLDLCECPLISDKGLVAVAQKCRNLMSVTLDSCVKIGYGGLQAIARMCPKLQSVSIKDCPLVGDKAVAGMISSASSSLTKIKLQNLNISDFALACLGRFGKAVTQLHLTNLENVTEKGFWVMGTTKGLQKLKTIIISSCSGVTDVGLNAVAEGCPSLKQLCLQRCCYLSDAGLKAFVEVATSLEQLQLEECHRITLMGVLVGLIKSSGKLKTLTLVRCFGIKDIGSFPLALPSYKSLRSLTIHDCPEFTSSSLATIGKICPNLVNLDLSGLVGVTDAGLVPVIESADQGLVKVSLKGCVNLTDSSIACLVKVHGDTLEVLNLDGCNKLTDKIPLAIAEHCTLLEELDVSKANITDYGVALLASARHLNIRILSLSGCSKVTSRSLPFFGNMGPTLTGLNLQHCNLIGTNFIAMLEEKMWWCDILA